MHDTATMPLSHVDRGTRPGWIEGHARLLLAIVGFVGFGFLGAGAIRQVIEWTDACGMPANAERAIERAQQELDTLRENRQRTIDESDASLQNINRAAEERFGRMTSGVKESACAESLVHRVVAEERELEAKRNGALQALDEAIARQLDRINRLRAVKAERAERAIATHVQKD